jgi:hypothetical protein
VINNKKGEVQDRDASLLRFRAKTRNGKSSEITIQKLDLSFGYKRCRGKKIFVLRVISPLRFVENEIVLKIVRYIDQ